jgi:hypothetical protein
MKGEQEMTHQEEIQVLLDELIGAYDFRALLAFLRKKNPHARTFRTPNDRFDFEVDDTFEVHRDFILFPRLVEEQHVPLVVFSVRVKRSLTARSCRQKQFAFARNCIHWCLRNLSRDLAVDLDGSVRQGLFVFHDDQGNFRLSLLTERPKDGRVEWSHYRRQTFFVERGQPNRTFRERMGLTWDSVAALRDAFSVEALNKEFYNELSNWYFHAIDKVRFPDDAGPTREERNATSLIRLITRMMFVWFMKQKGLIPDALFDKKSVDAMLQFRDKTGSTYYKAILQNLFFATLNTEMGPERKFVEDLPLAPDGSSEGHRIQYYYRYKRFFSDPARYLDLTRNVPFLNGGLFASLDIDKKRVDCFSTYEANEDKLAVPDGLFWEGSGEKRVDLSGITGNQHQRAVKIEGLIPLLKRFNFTVDESSKNDETVALDPELLGRVFENLLASYNPETRSTARKQTGSFYTPREIVDYMVEESLFRYLKTAMDLHDEKSDGLLRGLVTGSEAGNAWFDQERKAEITRALRTCRILDPACGSGAFPMGVLQAMLRVWDALDPVGSDTEIYQRKLELIENCIYGVDIQPIAVQISKLRCFISLLAEDEVDEGAANRGIEPLPNLEMHFVAANSLIGVSGTSRGNAANAPRQIEIGDDLVDRIKTQLTRLRHEWLTARRSSDKKQLQQKFTEEQNKLARELSRGGWYGKADSILLAAWNPFDQNTSSAFFDMEWMFGVNEGFDLVVGNPPYISAMDFKRIYGEGLRAELNRRYDSAVGAYDYFVLFMELGLRLCGIRGHVCFITPNKYLAAKYASGLRNWLLANASLLSVLDVSHLRVFEDVAVYPIVSMYAKRSALHGNVAVSLPVLRDAECFDALQYSTTLVPSSWLGWLPEKIWGFLLSPNVDLLPQIMKASKPLSSYGEVNATSTAAEADAYGHFLTTGCEPDALKVVNTGTIDRYVSLWGVSELTHQGKRFLGPYLPLGRARVNARRAAMYRSPKIVFAKMARTCEAVIDTDGTLASINTNCFYKPTGQAQLEYLCGVCNSRAFMVVYDLLFGALRMSGGYYQFQAPQLRVVLVPTADQEEQRKIGGLVERIVGLKLGDAGVDTSPLEAQIDEIVWRLYGVDPQKIEAAENVAIAGKGQTSAAVSSIALALELVEAPEPDFDALD